MQTGSTEIRAASDDLASRTEQQAASLESAANAMREVTSKVEESAHNAGAVRETIVRATDRANAGGDVVKRAVGAMDSRCELRRPCVRMRSLSGVGNREAKV